MTEEWGLPENQILLTGDGCLLYTSDAADERSSVDLGGRRIIKKKKYRRTGCLRLDQQKNKLPDTTNDYNQQEI